jgi:hypothetical protein
MLIFSILLSAVAFSADVNCMQLRVSDFARERTPLAALAHFSTAFANFREVPGLPGGLPAGTQGRYIRTKWIPPSILAETSYVTKEPRGRYSPEPMIKNIKLERESDIYLVSDDHSGSSAGVYIGELPGGRLVAVKAYDPTRRLTESVERTVEREAQAATAVSDLGIGPRFHGKTVDSLGRPALVFDIVPGDFIDMPITARTFADLETIFSRLRANGLTVSGDVQLYRGAQGELGMIDPLTVKKNVDPSRFPKEEHFVRLDLLSQAKLDVAQNYLRELAKNEPRIAAELRQAMKDYLAASYTTKGILPFLGPW